MSDAVEIRHCGRGDRGLETRNDKQARREWMMRFRFECPMSWDALSETSPGVRFCSECERSVHLCETVAEAEALALRGECVAIDRALAGHARNEATQMVLGRPDPLDFWARRIIDGTHR